LLPVVVYAQAANTDPAPLPSPSCSPSHVAALSFGAGVAGGGRNMLIGVLELLQLHAPALVDEGHGQTRTLRVAFRVRAGAWVWFGLCV